MAAGLAGGALSSPGGDCGQVLWVQGGGDA